MVKESQIVLWINLGGEKKMGKGDKRRPMQVPKEKFDENFERIFRSKNDKQKTLEKRISEIKHDKKSGEENE